MRRRIAVLALGTVVAVTACDRSATGPAYDLTTPVDVVDVMPDFEVSVAAVMDGAGVGASMLPDSLQLTTDQKARIAALHEAFMAATRADMGALRAIEAAARAARQAGKSREEVRAILAKATPILNRLHRAFAKLQADIWAVYTPQQRAWIAAHRPKVCGKDGPPVLSDAQVAAIRALRQEFAHRYRADVELIRQVHKEAEAARAKGRPRSEIESILARAKDAIARLRAGERKLQQDILQLLTDEQRAKWCIVRPLGLTG